MHNGPEAERHGFNARPTPKDLAETYLSAFERLVRAGVEAVMGAYNRTLDEPCCASRSPVGGYAARPLGLPGPRRQRLWRDRRHPPASPCDGQRR